MLTLSLTELLVYTEEEREKWRGGLLAHPDALAMTIQPEGRFATVAALVDHIFLVEARHLARLQREMVPEASGVTPGDAVGLFAYASRTRDALRGYAAKLDDVDAQIARE